MATSYDPADNPPFTSSDQLATYRNSVTTGVWKSCSHETNPGAGRFTKKLYTRAGSVPSGEDVRLFDVGNFEFATEGCANATDQVGQLWVTYDVTLFNPRLPDAVPASYAGFNLISTTLPIATPFLIPALSEVFALLVPPVDSGKMSPSGTSIPDLWTFATSGLRISMQAIGNYYLSAAWNKSAGSMGVPSLGTNNCVVTDLGDAIGVTSSGSFPSYTVMIAVQALVAGAYFIMNAIGGTGSTTVDRQLHISTVPKSAYSIVGSYVASDAKTLAIMRKHPPSRFTFDQYGAEAARNLVAKGRMTPELCDFICERAGVSGGLTFRGDPIPFEEKEAKVQLFEPGEQDIEEVPVEISSHRSRRIASAVQALSEGEPQSARTGSRERVQGRRD